MQRLRLQRCGEGLRRKVGGSEGTKGRSERGEASGEE